AYFYKRRRGAMSLRSFPKDKTITPEQFLQAAVEGNLQPIRAYIALANQKAIAATVAANKVPDFAYGPGGSGSSGYLFRDSYFHPMAMAINATESQGNTALHLAVANN